jgi:hypothetical protein
VNGRGMDTRSSVDRAIMDSRRYRRRQGDFTMAAMTDLVINARREGTRELLLTSGLIVVYTGLRGMARALGAIESVVR